MKNILVTGGPIYWLSSYKLLLTKYPEYNVINMDKLTYAGNKQI